MNELEVIHLFEDIGGMRLGLVHMPLHKTAFSSNIDNVRNIVRYASRQGVKTLILPPLLPHGIILSSGDQHLLQSIGISKRNPYIRILRHLARAHSISLISINTLEKSRTGVYISNIFVDGDTGIASFFSRKINLSRGEVLIGIKRGNRLDIVNDEYLNYSVLIGEDILYPELARILVAMGIDVLLTTVRGSELNYGLQEFIKSLQAFTAVPIIHIGSWIIDSTSIVLKTPTIITTPSQYIFEYNRENCAFITMPMKQLKESRRSQDILSFNQTFNILIRYIKRIHVLP